MTIEIVPDRCEIFFYRECGILTNILLALAIFRGYAGDHWPEHVIIHSQNRLNFSLGEDIRIVRENWVRIDEIYLAYADLSRDLAISRTHTKKIRYRKGIADESGLIFKSRRDKIKEVTE